MTSESTRKVIDQMNAANDEGKAELMVLDSKNNELFNKNQEYFRLICDQKQQITLHEFMESSRKEMLEVTIIWMIFSWILAGIAIGYAVWV